MKIKNLLEYKEQAIELIKENFSHLSGIDYAYELRDSNWGLSVGLFKEESGELVGVYILGAGNEPFGKIKGSGLQGIALAVREELRGQGLGHLLIEYSYSLGFDYVWGEQDKQLNNLSHWLKRRELLGEDETSFYTFRQLS